MKPSQLEFPTGQNWRCHGCTNCCRGNLLIQITAEEKARLEKQNWTTADGIDPNRIIVASLNHYRLAHQADGACVFLAASGQCRIHAKFGETAKPLACRMYPLTLHPAGKKLLVGLRFSCPSATANHGRALNEHRAEMTALARFAVPENYATFPPPAVSTNAGLDWPDFLRFTHWLDFTLANDAPTALKLLRALHWLNGVERGCLDQISGETADEILQALVENAAVVLPQLPAQKEMPSGFGRLFLRLMVLENARTVTIADQSVRSSHRWKMLAAALRLLRSSGSTPELRAELKAVKLAAMEKKFNPLTPTMEALLTRFFRVKIQSLHFCGKAFFDRPLIEGFRNLALLYPIIIWLARWLAMSAGRSELLETDLSQAIALVDYQYSYSPYFSWRTRLLQQRNDITKLCRWYA